MTNTLKERFEEQFDKVHSPMHHIGKDTIRSKDCEVCQKQRVINPKGYYKSYLGEEKCYWNEEMFQDVLAFIHAEFAALKEEVELEFVKVGGKEQVTDYFIGYVKALTKVSELIDTHL